VVTTGANPAPAASAVSRQPLQSIKPNDPRVRSELVRDLQLELRRVGCYSGPISGTWSPSSIRAMTALTERLNASLPVNEPDYVLLSLVTAQPGQVCGSGCPAGQVSAADGRCQPRSVAARASRDSGGQREALQSRAAEPLPGRMAAGGPQADIDAASNPRSAGRREDNARLASAGVGELTGHAPNSTTVEPETSTSSQHARQANRDRARADRQRRVATAYRRAQRYLVPFYYAGPPAGMR
jgi:hypothetical protein